MVATLRQVRTEALTKRFGHTLALRGVDACFEHGTITAIQGANGSGKSTLLTLLAQLTRPTKGRILFNDKQVARRRIKTGMVGHTPHAYLDLSALENLALAAALHGIGDPQRAAADAIERFQLHDFCERPLRTYSRGQLQRTSLARALIGQPDLLLLDEPSSGLDAASVEALALLLEQERERGTIVAFSTHDDTLANRLASRRLHLVAGCLQHGATR